MGNNTSTSLQPVGSPKLTTPLPQIFLASTMDVPKLSLFEIPEEQEESHQTENVAIQQIIEMKDFMQVSNGEKLNLLMFAINKINTSCQYKLDKITQALTCEEEGIFPRLHECEQNIDGHMEHIEVLKEGNRKLREDVDFLKGLAQVQDGKISHLQSNGVESRSRSMANNLVINGLCGDSEEENCQEKSVQFLKNKV